jgi:hypothetical protein
MEISDIENVIQPNPVLCLYYVLKTKTYLPEACKKIMPVLGTYLLDEMKSLEDPEAYHAMDIKLGKLNQTASKEYNRLYEQSPTLENAGEKNLAYAQALLAQCVTAVFSLAWNATAMLSGKDQTAMILSNATQFIATAAGSDGHKNPEDETDFETRWNQAAKDLAYIPPFPCSRSQVVEMLSKTPEADVEKKRVLSFLIR